MTTPKRTKTETPSTDFREIERKAVTSLADIAARRVRGYAWEPAQKFASSGNPDHFSDITMMLDIEANINTTGRVPPPKNQCRDRFCNDSVFGHKLTDRSPHDPHCEKTRDLLNNTIAFGSRLTLERMTGVVRGTTKFQCASKDTATFHFGCASMLEMWLDIKLTRADLEEALKEMDEAEY